jgi:alpha 1,2-mannosyltransferase
MTMDYHYFTRDGERKTRAEVTVERMAALKLEWQQHMQTVEPYPGRFQGNGIVMCAGGLAYFTCALISIRILRENGCSLPIEVWYYGKELNDEAIQTLGAYRVKCRNFLDYGLTAIIGYMLKPMAILHSSFEEVLFLDADNICIGDPEHLFYSEAYLKNGAIFWPDLWRSSPENPIWQITGVKPDLLQEQESGQLLIDKRKCWAALNLCVYFNVNYLNYYRILLGDKDTFKFAWLALNMPFYWIGGEPALCGYIDNGRFYGTTMVQYDISGVILFLHRNLVKWNHTPDWARVWQKIKSFNGSTGEKTYVLGGSPRQHPYMDIAGDTNMIDFREIFPHLEDTCMTMLQELKASEFYKRFASLRSTGGLLRNLEIS